MTIAYKLKRDFLVTSVDNISPIYVGTVLAGGWMRLEIPPSNCGMRMMILRKDSQDVFMHSQHLNSLLELTSFNSQNNLDLSIVE